MSMNLCFYTKAQKPRHIEFPFQTPTEWTWEIYNALPSEREAILRSKIATSPWLDDDLIKECVEMLNDSDLELSYI